MRRSFSQQLSHVHVEDQKPACLSQQLPEERCKVSLSSLSLNDAIKKRGRPAASQSVHDEFFGVYCLISRSPNKYFKNRCYIGYTVDPNRRLRQHNAGKQFGGAGKTDHRGPWDMVCIIHGFPNSVSALRFEWAWQNPEKSRRLKDLNLKKRSKETAFSFRLRIACHMLNSDPWRRLALTFRWLLPEYEIPFPSDVPPPSHMVVRRGLVEKVSTFVPQTLYDYILIRPCGICSRTIASISEVLRCGRNELCGAHYHARCLAKKVLQDLGNFNEWLFPAEGKCPKCGSVFRWGDLVHDQRTLLSIDSAKPTCDEGKLASGMVPASEIKKV